MIIERWTGFDRNGNIYSESFTSNLDVRKHKGERDLLIKHVVKSIYIRYGDYMPVYIQVTRNNQEWTKISWLLSVSRRAISEDELRRKIQFAIDGQPCTLK